MRLMGRGLSKLDLARELIDKLSPQEVSPTIRFALWFNQHHIEIAEKYPYYFGIHDVWGYDKHEELTPNAIHTIREATKWLIDKGLDGKKRETKENAQSKG